jgi:hypothetical protein
MGGVQRILTRLHITWRRARSYVHSPDPHYTAKLADLERICAAVAASDGRLRLCYLDEVTVMLQPTLAAAYAPIGQDAPRASRSWAADSVTRLIGTLDHADARVVYYRGTISLASIGRFYQQLWAAYKDIERLYVVQDNWPIHYHPDVLIMLEPQLTRWPFPRPGNWPATPSRAAVQRAGGVRLPIQIVPLPTYASWCNPIEKLWRLLRQELTHLHPWATDRARLREQIDQFLDQFAQGAPNLLQYVGLA